MRLFEEKYENDYYFLLEPKIFNVGKYIYIKYYWYYDINGDEIRKDTFLNKYHL